MDEVVLKIAGEITLSQNPGASLKKWREIFAISQTELANHIKVTPSTISDYEGNRRKSPGIKVIKRFVMALCDIDKEKGGWVIKKLETSERKDIYEVIDFSAPMEAMEFVKLIEGKVLSNPRKLRQLKIYGYTSVDSLRAILELPVEEFTKMFGSTTERAAVFTNVSLGRSPLVAVRVMKLKPSMIVLHNLQGEIDPLALKIAEVEKIPIVSTVLPLDQMKEKCGKKK